MGFQPIKVQDPSGAVPTPIPVQTRPQPIKVIGPSGSPTPPVSGPLVPHPTENPASPPAGTNMTKVIMRASDYTGASLSVGEDFGALQKLNGLMDEVMSNIDASRLDADNRKLADSYQRAIEMYGNPLSKKFDPQEAMATAAQFAQLFGPGSEYLNQQFAAHHTRAGRGSIVDTLESTEAQSRLDHPAVNAVMAFFAEFANPENYALGGLGRAAKVLSEISGASALTRAALKPVGEALSGAAAKMGAGIVSKAPWVAHLADGTVATITHAKNKIVDFFDRFAGLARITPEAAHVARKALAAKSRGASFSRRTTLSAFENLDVAQQREVVHLSQGQARDSSVPDPVKGKLPWSKQPLTLQQRAQIVRRTIKRLDTIQRATHPDMLPKGRAHNSDTFFPLPTVKELGLEAENAKAAGLPMRGRSPAASPDIRVVGPNAHEKVYATLADRLREAPHTLPDHVDMATYFDRHVSRVLSDVAAERAFQEWDSMGLLLDNHYSFKDPTTGEIHDFGLGRQGKKAAQNYAARHGTFLAQKEAMQKVGIDKIPRRNSIGKLAAMGREVTRARKLVEPVDMAARKAQLELQFRTQAAYARGKISTKATAIHIEQSGGKRTIQTSSKALSVLQTRAHDLAMRYQKAQLDAATREVFDQEFRSLGGGAEHARQIMDTINLNISDQAAGTEFKGQPFYASAPAELGLSHTPSVEYKALHQALFKFMSDSGARDEEARAATSFFDATNRWARAGIVAVPVVHVAWNLFNNYLVAGGELRLFDPFNGENIWKGSYLPPADVLAGESRKGWRAFAEREGATIPIQSQMSLMGNPRTARLMTLPGRNLSDWMKPNVKGQLTRTETIDKYLTQYWMRQQHFVFEIAEGQMATSLFRTYVERDNIAPAEAAVRVRKAFGDYMNVTVDERAVNLNKALFFYPWLKSMIPFYAAHGFIDPKVWNMPVTAIRDYNQSFGYDDPGVGQNEPNPFALHISGDQAPLVLPFPQKYFGLAANAVVGDFDGRGLNAHAGAAWTFLGHLNPLLATGVAATTTLIADPQIPGEKPYIAFDKRQPALNSLEDLAKMTASNFAFPLRQAETASSAGVSGLKSLLTVVPGGYWKKEKDAQTAKSYYEANNELGALYKAFKDDPDETRSLIDIENRLEQGDTGALATLKMLYSIVHSATAAPKI